MLVACLTLAPTRVDAQSASVVSTSPPSGATAVDPGTVVSVVFSAAVQPSTIDFVVGPLHDNEVLPVAGAKSYDAATNTLTFTPSSPLSAGILHGARLYGPLQHGWSFTTSSVAPRVTARSPQLSAPSGWVGEDENAGVREPVRVTFDVPIVASTLSLVLRDDSGAVVPGTLAYDPASRTATLTPSAPLALRTQFTATTSGAASAATGAVMLPDTFTFETPNCQQGCKLWANTSHEVIKAGDGPLELGLRLRADLDGYLTGVEYLDTSHTAHVWSSSGQLLGSARFPATVGGSGGTQNIRAVFEPAIPVQAGATYVVSVYLPQGGYNYQYDYFASRPVVQRGPFTILTDGASGPNGLYHWGGEGFPTDSYRSTNYWIDPVFSTTLPADTTAPRVASRSPLADATDASASDALRVVFSEAVQAATIGLSLRDAGGAAVPGAVAYDAATRTASYTPSSPLAFGALYTATISGAADLAGNLMAADSWSFRTAACPCTLWPPSATPGTASVGAGAPLELGVKFAPDVAGYATGLRFYKGPGNSGAHVGHLWSSSGQLLATADFGGESASGWQEVALSPPVALAAGATYVASYTAPNAGYAFDGAYFAAAGVTRGPLRTPTSAGVFALAAGAFPSQSYNAANYWVDVSFATSLAPETIPPTVSARSPAAGATDVALKATVSATFSEPVQAGTIALTVRDGANALVAGAVAYDSASRTATFTPAAPLALGTTFSVSLTGAADPSGNVMAPESWSFSTAACPCSLFPSSATPGTASVAAGSPVELGVKLVPEVSGHATGVRFYKGANNTGTHVGSLWSSSGQLLSSATFANESATGWQQVSFSPPVALVAGTTYVVSYTAPNAGYAYDGAYFAAKGVTRGPLRTPTSAGVYALAAGVFPDQSYNATNYWVDVVFATDVPPDTTAPTIATRSPAAGATDAALKAAITATFSEPVQAGTILFALRDGAGAPIAGAVAFNPATRTATFTPSAPLVLGTGYTASLSGATDPTGNVMAAATWSFSTPTCPCSLWSAGATPSTASVGPGSPVELGVKFVPEVNGHATGVRFYKGAGNTGTHVGHLWSSSGALLGLATFTNESATGWQQVSFSPPVALTAGTTYVASYTAPNAGYAFDGAYFATKGLSSGPLGTPTSAGVFALAAGAFPSQSYNAANYWVDVVFATNVPPDTTGPAIARRSPAASATDAALRATVSATFTEPVQAGTIAFAVRDGASAPVAGAFAYDPAALTATFTPSAPLALGATYTVAVSGATDASGNVMAADGWSFSTPTCPCKLWASSVRPQDSGGTDEVVNGQPQELGLRFTAEVDGYAAAVRFYKGGDNLGAHVGHLWSDAGQLLATATFGNESATGWQQAWLSPSVVLTAGKTYTVSYTAPKGYYAFTPKYFATGGVAAGPLRTAASAGVFAAPGGFPNQSFNGANYWVDLLFTITPPDTTAPTIQSRAPAAGAVDVALSATVSATFSEPLQSGSLAIAVRDGANAPVNGALAYDAATRTATFTPGAPLVSSTNYSVTLTGVVDPSGNAMPDASWTFRTTPCPCSFWSSTTAPAASVDGGGPHELGLRFTSDVAGTVTGARFHKASGNTGTHVAHLWSSTGALLASATFTNESATGWQQVSFPTPVAVTAGATYVVSYHAPNGGYSYDSAYFALRTINNGPLRTPADGVNGVFATGPSAFPTQSYNATNYWVDVVFMTNP